MHEFTSYDVRVVAFRLLPEHVMIATVTWTPGI